MIIKFPKPKDWDARPPAPRTEMAEHVNDDSPWDGMGADPEDVGAAQDMLSAEYGSSDDYTSDWLHIELTRKK